MNDDPILGREAAEARDAQAGGDRPASIAGNVVRIDRFRMVLARLHSSGRAERAPTGDSQSVLIHHVPLKDFVRLIEIFGSPIGEGFIDEPGFWTVDDVCYSTPAWLELLAP